MDGSMIWLTRKEHPRGKVKVIKMAIPETFYKGND